MPRFIAVSAIAALLVAACSQGADNGGETAASKPSGVVEFQFEGEQEEVAIYEAVVEAFENQNPKVDVKLVPVADRDEHLQRMTTSMASGKPPDVFLVNFRFYSQFVARGGIEPFGEHADRVGVDVADYYEPPIEAFTYEGQLQCMPQNISSLVVYYNKKLFQQAGLEEPADDWTWDDFRTTAKTLTSGDVRGLGIEPSIIRIAPFVWQNGGELVDDLAEPTRFTLDEPTSRDALEFITALVREDGSVPTEEEVAAQDLETRFTTGKLGMLLSSRRDTPAFREVIGLDWDVAPLPVGRQQAGILHSDAYCIPSEADNIDAAAAFIAFAIGNQGQRITALGGRTVPSLMSVATTPAFLDPSQAPSRSKVFLDAIPTIQRTPVIPTWPEIEDVAEEILTRMFYEPGYTVDQAIQDLDEQTRDLLAEGSSG